MISRHAELASGFAGSLGLDAAVQEAVASSYERWDGRGWPGTAAGRGDPAGGADLTARRAPRGGPPARRGRRARRGWPSERSGRQFDPALATLVERAARRLFLDTTPHLADGHRRRAGAGAPLQGRSRSTSPWAVADFVDLKSPYTLGHSRAVADLSAAAGRVLGMSEADVTCPVPGRTGPRPRPARRVQRDLGQGGPLGAGERERIRLYPYLTERILSQSPALARLGASPSSTANGSTGPATRGASRPVAVRRGRGPSRQPTLPLAAGAAAPSGGARRRRGLRPAPRRDPRRPARRRRRRGGAHGGGTSRPSDDTAGRRVCRLGRSRSSG